jgi:uncharacterized protein
MRCNLQCGYCYEDPLREAGNFGEPYNLEGIKSAVWRETNGSEPFLLFGGEPLLLPKKTLEEIWAWGLIRSGRNVIQTNGTLIDDDHIALFRKYKVGVGISIDGPGDLNDVRWNQNLEKTRASTKRTERAIEQLCDRGLKPSLIVTLHRLNATGSNLDRLLNWFSELSRLGVSRIGLHLLEVESEQMRERFQLSNDECIAALQKLRALRAKLPRVTFSLLNDLDSLMIGRDSSARCIWQACDPYTTPAVRGIGGQGERTKCSRVNKEGVDFLPSAEHGFERYIALHRTPQQAGGCKDCRFFLACRGQCPGTAIGGDWRNRSEQCNTWKKTFETIEKELLDQGATPVSLNPQRIELEECMVESWNNGRNATVETIVGSRRLSNRLAPDRSEQSNSGSFTNTRLFPDRLPFHLRSFSRLAWASEAARISWEPAFQKVRNTIVQAEFASVSSGLRKAALFQLTEGELNRMEPWCRDQGLAREQLYCSSSFLSKLLEAVCVRYAEPTRFFVVGRPPALSQFSARMQSSDYYSAAEILGYPECCASALHAIETEDLCHDTTWATAVHGRTGNSESREVVITERPETNIFLRKIGVRALAHHPCSFGCVHSVRHAAELKALITGKQPDETDVYRLLETMLSWPLEWSALHGIAEVKSPVLKLCYQTDATSERYVIRWAGTGYPSEAARGLCFPYRSGDREIFRILQ